MNLVMTETGKEDNQAQKRKPGTKFPSTAYSSGWSCELFLARKMQGKVCFGIWKWLFFPDKRYRQDKRTYLWPSSLLECAYDAWGMTVTLWPGGSEHEEEKLTMLPSVEKRQKESRCSITLLSRWKKISNSPSQTFLSCEKNKTLFVYPKSTSVKKLRN